MYKLISILLFTLIISCSSENQNPTEKEEPPKDIASGVNATSLAPIHLNAVPFDSYVVLTWNFEKLTGDLILSRSINAEKGFSQIYKVKTDEKPQKFEYIDRGLVNGVTYYYSIQFIPNKPNTVFITKDLFIVSATPIAIPFAPTGFNLIAGDSQVSLSWNASIGATSYNILRSTTSGSGYSLVNHGTSTTFLNTGLVNGVTYYYVVQASNGSGTSQNSIEKSATPVLPPPPPPQAPDDFKAIAGNEQVKLSWSIVPDASEYILTRADINNSKYVEIAKISNSAKKEIVKTTLEVVNAITVDEKNVISYLDLKVENKTTYSYIVYARNSGGMSKPSKEVTATPAFPVSSPTPSPIPPLMSPTGLTVSAGNTQAIVSWDLVANATKYNLRRYNTTTGYTTISNLTQAQYTDLGLVNGSTYIYWVQAVNNTQVSVYSASATVTLPSAPHVPTFTYATASDAQISLNWSSVAGADSYILKRAKQGESNFTQIATLTETSYLDSDVTNGLIHFYVVQAQNQYGTSGNSNVKSATPYAHPSVPLNFVASPRNQNVQLSWSDCLGATQYKVKRSTISGSGYTVIVTVNSTEYIDYSVSNNTTYYYVVEAVNPLFSSGNSVEKTATPHPFPYQPTGFKITSGDQQLILSWDPQPFVNYYAVYRTETPGSSYLLVAFIDSNSYTDTGLANDSVYSYRVQAINTYGTSDPTADVLASPIAPLDVSKHVLVVYNSSSSDSIEAMNYYKIHRPGFSQANYLGVATPQAEIINDTSYQTTLRNPIVNWLTDPIHSTKSIRYIVLLYGIATRVDYNSVGYRLSRAYSELGIRTGANYDVGGTGADTNSPYIPPLFPGTTALVTHVGMASLEDTKAYIDKLEYVGSHMQHPSVILSAKDADLGGANYEFDDTGRNYSYGSGPGYFSAQEVLTANNAASINYQYTNHITNAENVTAYQTWGANGGQGGMYALDGSVIFTGKSNWYIINTFESFNGQANSWQGHWTQWFQQTAFGGTNYENTPIFAVGHTEEPYLSGAIQSGYFKHYEEGYLAIECAWATRSTPYFLSVGDPLVKR